MIHRFKAIKLSFILLALCGVASGAPLRGAACADAIKSRNAAEKEKLTPKLVTDREDPCFVDYGAAFLSHTSAGTLVESERVNRVKAVRHFLADLVEYRASEKASPVSSKKRVMETHKQTVLSLLKHKGLLEAATADLASIAKVNALDGGLLGALFELAQERLKELRERGALDFLSEALPDGGLDALVDAPDLPSLLAGAGALAERGFGEAGLRREQLFEDFEAPISVLYDFIFLGQAPSKDTIGDTRSEVQRLVADLADLQSRPSLLDFAYSEADKQITEAVSGVQVHGLVLEHMGLLEQVLFPAGTAPDPQSDFTRLDGKTRLKLFAVDLIENHYFAAMDEDIEQKKRLFASVLRQTIPLRGGLDQPTHLLTGLMNGSGTFLQKLLQKVVGLLDSGGGAASKRSEMTDAELRVAQGQCVVNALQGAKSKLSKNPEFATLKNFKSIEQASGEILASAYLGKASVGVAMLAHYRPEGESVGTCIAYKELRNQVKERFLREYAMIKRLAQSPKHDVAGFVVGIGDRIVDEMNLGGEKGELENLERAHQSYYLSAAPEVHDFGDGKGEVSAFRVGAMVKKAEQHPGIYPGFRDFNATVVPVDSIEGFPRNKEFMAMAVAPGSEFSRVVKMYKEAAKSNSTLSGALAWIRKERGLTSYDATDLKIDIYSQMYLVRQLVYLWMDKALFSPGSGVFHSDLHEGNMFMSIDTQAVRKGLGAGAASVDYGAVQQFASAPRDEALNRTAPIRLTMIDFGAWEVVEKSTVHAMLNLVISAIIGSPDGFFQSLSEFGKQFPVNKVAAHVASDGQLTSSALTEDMNHWAQVMTAPKFVHEATSAIMEVTGEDGKTEDIAEKLTHLILVKMMMEHNVIPPKQVTAFLEGFLALRNAAEGFAGAVNGLNELGAGIQELGKADAVSIIRDRAQKALLDDLFNEGLNKLGDGSPESFELVMALATDMFNPIMLGVNAVTKGKSLLFLKRLANGDSRLWINQGNRKVAIEKVGFKFTESLKLREFTPLSCDREHSDEDAGLCYEPCPEGYQGVGPVCWPSCPAGLQDRGISCAKGEPYGRGVGYPWQLGHKAFSLDGARANCLREHPQGCEQQGAIIYPKCRPGYRSFGSNICTPECPEDAGGPMVDQGAFCLKNAKGRGVGVMPNSCELLRERFPEKQYRAISGSCFASCNSHPYKERYKSALRRAYAGNGWDYTATVQHANLLNLDVFCAQVPERIVDVLGVHVGDDTPAAD